jgi:curved DNA-binding protein CbpA
MQLVQRILRTKDYYDILEVPKESGDDVIKRAYKKLALKLHPDKNKAPGAEEAFKKLSKAMQCLSDGEKKKVYDRYGDEERIPQQHRQQYQQDFMTPEDLFAAFFGGGATFHNFHGGHHHQRQHQQHHDDDGNPVQMHRAQLIQALPVLLLVLLTLASNFASRDGGSRFSFSPSAQYNNQRSTAALDVSYYVTDDFEQHYAEGTRVLADFERQVEIYYVRNLHSECDYQEKMMYKKVMIAKRKGDQEEMKSARAHPRPACKELEKIKRSNNNIYRSAMYMGAY